MTDSQKSGTRFIPPVCKFLQATKTLEFQNIYQDIFKSVDTESLASSIE